jgi:hypothetical protein
VKFGNRTQRCPINTCPTREPLSQDESKPTQQFFAVSRKLLSQTCKSREEQRLNVYEVTIFEPKIDDLAQLSQYSEWLRAAPSGLGSRLGREFLCLPPRPDGLLGSPSLLSSGYQDSAVGATRGEVMQSAIRMSSRSCYK